VEGCAEKGGFVGMQFVRRPILTRRRLLATAVLILVLLLAGLVGARRSIALWAMHRALAAAGLEPATFQIRSVDLNTLRVADLSVGKTPWLTARGLDATFSLTSLLAGRVNSISMHGAKWNVQVRDGAIDWGFIPTPSGGPLALEMPFDRAELLGSVVRVSMDDVLHEFPIAVDVTAGAPSGLACRVDLVVPDRTVTLMAHATATVEGLTVDVKGRAEPIPSPEARVPAITRTGSATLNATLFRALSDGSIKIDGTIALDSLVERVGDIEVGVAQAITVGHVVLDGRGKLNESFTSIQAQGVRVGELAIRTAELKLKTIDGSRVEFTAAAAGEGWDLPGVAGAVVKDANTGVGSTKKLPSIFAMDVHTTVPAVLNMASGGATGRLDSAVGSVRVRTDGIGISILDGNLEMHGGSLRAGDISLSDVEAAVFMRSPEAVELALFTAVVGDGATISAAPFTFNPRAPLLQTRLSMTNLSLAEWLPVVTARHATGEGRVSGYIDVGVDLTTGSPRLERVSGALRADPAHGFLQATDAEALGALLDAQDPRLATDETMRPVRDKIVAALHDFAFQALSVDLAREHDQTVARAYLSGFGRHGDDPQGLNITLDLHVPNALIELGTRMATESKLRGAARNALDRFFEAPASEVPHP